MISRPMRQIEDIFDLVASERLRQFDLPGTENDINKGPNDWIVTVIACLGEAASRHGMPPSREEFEDALTKASAVIVAAFQHAELMKSKNKLR